MAHEAHPLPRHLSGTTDQASPTRAAPPSRGSGNVWAADWWRYPEAVSRIEALWRAWEHLRLDPATGMSVWFRDHADHHMRVLMNPEWGPLGKHGSETEDSRELIPHLDPPGGLFAPRGDST